MMQAEAYFLIVQDMYLDDVFLNKDIKYLAVDLTGVLLDDKQALIELLNGFCESNGYILLQETLPSLREKGYLLERFSRFAEGILISFKDMELTADCLRTSCEKFRDGLGARGADFIAERQDGVWVLTVKDNLWVS